MIIAQTYKSAIIRATMSMSDGMGKLITVGPTAVAAVVKTVPANVTSIMRRS